MPQWEEGCERGNDVILKRPNWLRLHHRFYTSKQKYRDTLRESNKQVVWGSFLQVSRLSAWFERAVSTPTSSQNTRWSTAHTSFTSIVILSQWRSNKMPRSYVVYILDSLKSESRQMFISTSHCFCARYTSLTVNDVAIKDEILSARFALRSAPLCSQAYLQATDTIRSQRACEIGLLVYCNCCLSQVH